jgi:hypothetical protein
VTFLEFHIRLFVAIIIIHVSYSLFLPLLLSFLVCHDHHQDGCNIVQWWVVIEDVNITTNFKGKFWKPYYITKKCDVWASVGIIQCTYTSLITISHHMGLGYWWSLDFVGPLNLKMKHN